MDTIVFDKDGATDIIQVDKTCPNCTHGQVCIAPFNFANIAKQVLPVIEAKAEEMTNYIAILAQICPKYEQVELEAE